MDKIMATLWWMIVLAFVPAIFCGYSSPHSSHVSVFGSLNSDCSETIPCNVTDSVCQEGKCQCRSGYTSNYKKTKCLKIAVAIQDSCEENVQCLAFLGSISRCQDKKCECYESFYEYMNGRCELKYILGERCSSYGSTCFAGSEFQAASCQESICKCNDGFYQRDRLNCRRKMKSVGNECLLDMDCDFENATCVERKCVLNGKPLQTSLKETVRQVLVKEENVTIGTICKSNDDCKSIGNSICDVDGTCICNRAHFPSKDNTSCIPEIGEACDPKNPGVHVEHAVCRDNMWTCPIDRFRTNYNRECRELGGDIGGICQDNEQCQLVGPGGECYLNRCFCPNHSHYDEKEHYCRLELGAPCKKDSDCELANSLCHDSTCSCTDNHFDLGGQCVPGIGVKCNSHRDCKNVNNSACLYGATGYECQCTKEFVATANHPGLCLDRMQLHEDCQYNEQCSKSVAHTFCNVATARCECLDGYFSKDGDCYQYKELGFECAESHECSTPNSRCKDGICKCLPTHVSFDDQCVLKLGAGCEDDNDCGMPGTICELNKCACKENLYEVDGRCVVGLEGQCQNNNDCKMVNNTMCHNGLCKCEPNLVAISGECLPKLQYREVCKYSEQCKATVPLMICNKTVEASVCECEPDYYFKQNKCHKKQYLDNECTEEDQCFAENSHCQNGRCVCFPKFTKKNGMCSSTAITRPLFSIIAMILLGLKTLF